MDELVNTSGRGQLGTDTNSPVGDGGTLARTQNRPNVARGTMPDGSTAGSYQMGLTEADRRFIQDIHNAKHLDGSPLRLDELLCLRAENIRMQRDAARDFGPGSKTVAWFQEVIAAYDEEIAKANSPLGSAINELKTVLADPNAKEKDMSEKVSKMLGVMRQEELMGVDDDDSAEATKLIEKVVDRSGVQRTAALETLVKKEQVSSGAVSEDQFREAIGAAIGVERQRQLLGMADDDEGQKKSTQVMQAVANVIHLVSERRIKAAKTLIEQEKASMGSVSDEKFKQLISSLLGDEREKQLMGLSDDKSDGVEIVQDIFELVLKRRNSAVADLLRKQATPNSGVTNAQINRAIEDLDLVKEQARRLGIAVPLGEVVPGNLQIDGK